MTVMSRKTSIYYLIFEMNMEFITTICVNVLLGNNYEYLFQGFHIDYIIFYNVNFLYMHFFHLKR